MTTLRPPPGWARRLLRAGLPAALRDDIAANLEDLHAARARAGGQRRADAWYWRQALTFPLRFRLAGVAVPRPFTTRTSFMRSVIQDLRHVGRVHRARPGVALIAGASLAIGIGLNTAIFSVVNGVLLRPSPIDGIEQLAVVWETDRNTGTTREPGSVPDFLDYRRLTRTFDAIGGLIAAEANLTPESGDPVRLAAISASHDLLPIFGVEARDGRVFTAAEDAPGGPLVAMISDRLRDRLFGDDAPIGGRVVRLDDQPYAVVGVVPDEADFGIRQVLRAAAYSRGFVDRGRNVRVDVWRPLQPNPVASARGGHPLIMVGRLAPPSTFAAAGDEMAQLAADLERQYPDSNLGRGAHVEPLADVIYGPSRPALVTLMVAVALVLLVACVNVANLLLARGTSRRREVAVRSALGAGSWRLVRQFLVEAVALAVVAGAAGVGLAYAAVAWFASRGPADVPQLAQVTVDARVLLYALSVSIVVGVLFGIVPALQALGVAPQSALTQDAGRSDTGGRDRRRVRSALVVAELALAVVLVVAAGLLVRSFASLRGVDPGFSPSGVVKAEYQLPRSRYPANFASWPNFKEMHAFTAAVLERAATLPGVASVAVASGHPLDPGFTSSLSIVGRPPGGDPLPEISIRLVTPGYFSTVGLELERGRLIEPSDTTTSPTVALINTSAAERLFPGEDPIGREIAMWGAQRRIVGIVANERFHGIAAAPPIAVYYPLAQAPSAGGTGVLLARSAGAPAETLMPLLTKTIREVDPALAVFGVEALDDTLALSIGERRFTATLLALFACMALLLAAIGIHGVLNLGVSERAREIGIRMALGARPERLRRRVLAEGLTLAGFGLAIGLVLSVGLTRYLQSMLFGITRFDLVTFAGVAAVLAVVAAASSYLPARRATRIEPGLAMRDA